MPHVTSVIIASALLTIAAVNVIAAGAKMDATRNHYAAPVAGISVALPSGMKSFPVELPE
jgi:hypothetical protein